MSNDIRTIEAINADIDALNKAGEEPGAAPVSGSAIALLTLEAKARTAIEKYEAAKRTDAAQERVRSIKKDDAVSFLFGRAASKRIESGIVQAVGDNGSGLQFNVLVGEGIKSSLQLVGADALLLDADDVARAEAEVAEAKAEADRKAKEKEAAEAAKAAGTAA